MAQIVRFAAFALVLSVPSLASAAEPPKDVPAEGAEKNEVEEKPTSLSLSAGAMLPTGNLADGVGLGLGGMLGVDHAIVPRVALVGRTGYIHHLPKDGIAVTLGAVPIWAGARYRFSGTDEGGYLEALAGPTILFASVDRGRFGRQSDSEVRLGTALGGGYKFGKLDLGARLVFYDLGHAGDSMGLMASAGYSFAAF